MKQIPFPQNERDCSFVYCNTREGPNGFICYYKNAAVIRTDPLEAWRVLGIARFTDTGKALKAWCIAMNEQYGNKELPEQGRPDGSFASEAMAEEPNDNTKMIT